MCWVGFADEVKVQVYRKSDYDRLGTNAKLVTGAVLKPSQRLTVHTGPDTSALRDQGTDELMEAQLELMPGEYATLIVADSDITEQPPKIVVSQGMVHRSSFCLFGMIRGS